MNLKVKAALSVFMAALMAFMMIETPYTGALGDYVLEFFGLRSWTGDHTGFHITILYFGILFLISLILVGRYAVEGLKLKRRTVFIFFAILMILFTTASGATARNIKAHSPGLLPIGYNANDSRLEYTYQNNAYSAFVAEFELTNYSDTPKAFSISFDSPDHRENGISPIQIQTPDGKTAIYHLGPRQSIPYTLDLNNCKPVGGPTFQTGGASGSVQELILTDENGNSVQLTGSNFFGLQIVR